jgi:hypothetical protein
MDKFALSRSAPPLRDRAINVHSTLVQYGALFGLDWDSLHRALRDARGIMRGTGILFFWMRAHGMSRLRKSIIADERLSNVWRAQSHHLHLLCWEREHVDALVWQLRAADYVAHAPAKAVWDDPRIYRRTVYERADRTVTLDVMDDSNSEPNAYLRERYTSNIARVYFDPAHDDDDDDDDDDHVVALDRIADTIQMDARTTRTTWTRSLSEWLAGVELGFRVDRTTQFAWMRDALEQWWDDELIAMPSAWNLRDNADIHARRFCIVDSVCEFAEQMRTTVHKTPSWPSLHVILDADTGVTEQNMVKTLQQIEARGSVTVPCRIELQSHSHLIWSIDLTHSAFNPAKEEEEEEEEVTDDKIVVVANATATIESKSLPSSVTPNLFVHRLWNTHPATALAPDDAMGALAHVQRVASLFPRSKLCVGIQTMLDTWIAYLGRQHQLVQQNVRTLPNVLLTYDPANDQIVAQGRLPALMARGGALVAKISINTIGKRDSHANILLIRPDLRTIEWFEPHGRKSIEFLREHDLYSGGRAQLALRRLFSDANAAASLLGLDKSYRVIEPYEECRTLTRGPQARQHPNEATCTNGGFCVTYSTLYAHLRCLAPQASPAATVRSLDVLDGKDMLTLVLHYLGWQEAALDHEAKEAGYSNWLQKVRVTHRV